MTICCIANMGMVLLYWMIHLLYLDVYFVANQTPSIDFFERIKCSQENLPISVWNLCYGCVYVPVCTRKWNCVLHLDYCTGTGLQRGVQIRKLIWRNRGRTDNSYFKAFQRISIDLQESFLHEHNYNFNFLEHWERNKNLYVCLLYMILNYLLKKFWIEKVVS